ncbi:MAG: FliA/WhiG family RNA polymerase sigma factor [Tissierellia bacterium]|nr:FliA/WhiG family RNA polymerase sigma factor [Tissierellia bacterium]
MILSEKYQTVVTDNELWEQYYASRDIKIRNKIIEKYSYLVKIIALKFRSIYQQYGDVEDIVNEGIIALMDVIEKYDISKNIKFETYASIRIKGSIIDYVRKQDWIPRKVKSDYKIVKDAEVLLSNKLGRDPKDSEVAEYLKIDINEYNQIINNAYGNSLLSFEELLGEASIRNNVTLNPFNLPEQEMEDKELHKVLSDSINNLNDKEKLVISLYYKEEIKLKEIAEIMNISNSRVSQIHTAALHKLGKNIKNYLKR